MTGGKKSKGKGASVVPDPPMKPLRETLDRAGKTIEELRAGMLGDPAANFTRFVERPIPNLAERRFGSWDDIALAYVNSFMAHKFTVDVAHAVEGVGAKASPRAEVAGVNVIAGCETVQSALLLHLRPEPWNDRMAMALARTALECSGRGAALALGKRDEFSRWTADKRVEPWEGYRALDPIVKARRPSASEASVVYGWLCNFTHVTQKGLQHFYEGRTNRHEDTYCALAYVGWTLAVVAEHVIGNVTIAQWPRLPDELPWSG